MKSSIKLSALAVVAALSLSACTTSTSPYSSTLSSGPKQTAGTITGAVIGGVAGSQFGKGDGKLAAVGIGTLAGAMMGSGVGQSLDRADQVYYCQQYPHMCR